MAGCIFFDIGGTILHFAPSHAVVVGAALRELGLDVSPEFAAERVRAARKAQGGRPNPIDLEANRLWWLELFGRVVRELAGGENGALRDELYRRHRAGDWLQPARDTVETLESLSARGHRMAVISNWDDTLETILDRRGLRHFFDFLVCSSDVGAAKPDPRIFRAALTRAGVRPSEAVHVGDEFAADVRGARDVGIRPILLGSHGRGPEGESVETIGSLAELLDLVR